MKPRSSPPSASSNRVGLSAQVAADALAKVDARFALVGGLAVSARAEPRYTRDVDFALAVANDREAEQILFKLRNHGYELRFLVEQTGRKRLATARLIRTHEPEVFIDLLFASCGIEPELIADAELLDFLPGMRLPVATVGHLIALKVLSEKDTRLQDRLDLAALGKEATASDWQTALEAVSLIKERGFHRGRALRSRLRRWRTQVG